MNTVQGDAQGAMKAFDLGIEAGLSLARFSDTLTARLSAADRCDTTHLAAQSAGLGERESGALTTALDAHRERTNAARAASIRCTPAASVTR